MYIGGTDGRGLMYYFGEMLDFALDEFRCGLLSKIVVALRRDQSISISDDGTGLSLAALSAPYYGTAFEKLLTDLTWSHRRNGIYSSFYLPGPCVVNALSSEFYAETRTAGQQGTIRFSCGQLVEPLRIEPFCGDDGCTMRFRYDSGIFQNVQFDAAALRHRLWEQAAFHPGVRIEFQDEASGTHEVFRSPDGVTTLIRKECQTHQVVWPEPLRLEMHEGPFRYDVAIHCVRRDAFAYSAFANSAPTPGWGTHVVATRDGLATVFRRLARQRQTEKASLPLEKLLRGIVVAVAVDLPDAKFEGPTREKLANHEIEQSIRDFVTHGLTNLLNRKPDHVRTWLEWFQTADSD
jgi:DNA gyrase subunit B